MKAFKLSLIALVALVCIFSIPARCEVSMGFVPSTQDLERVRSSWKLLMVSTKDRQDKESRETRRGGSHETSDIVTKKARTHGCFIWCVLRGIPKGPTEIKFSYSYGEASSEIAVKKAVNAFDSRAGICEREMPTIEYAQGGDF
jgi:hypothetical protein